MREEARQPLQLVQRSPGPLRQRYERVLRQVAVLSLNRAKLFDDYRPVPRPDMGQAAPYRPVSRVSTGFRTPSEQQVKVRKEFFLTRWTSVPYHPAR